jgi:plastocyanin
MSRALCTLLLILSATPAFAETYTIGVNGFTYVPNNLTVAPGDRVDVTASSFHPFRIDNFASCNANCSIDVIPQLAGAEAVYYCMNHGQPAGTGMAGIVRVLNVNDRVFIGRFEN